MLKWTFCYSEVGLILRIQPFLRSFFIQEFPWFSSKMSSLLTFPGYWKLSSKARKFLCNKEMFVSQRHNLQGQIPNSTYARNLWFFHVSGWCRPCLCHCRLYREDQLSPQVAQERVLWQIEAFNLQLICWHFSTGSFSNCQLRAWETYTSHLSFLLALFGLWEHYLYMEWFLNANNRT